MTIPFSIKRGVDASKLKPQTLLAISIAQQVYTAHNIPFVVTSIAEGRHRPDSLHYEGGAFDCRVPSHYRHRNPNWNEDMDRLVTAELLVALGGEAGNGTGQYDVLLEDKPPHIHVEFDPV